MNDPQAVMDALARFLGRTALASGTVSTYLTGVRSLTGWLAGPGAVHHRPTDVFTDPMARDFAVRDWQHWMVNTARLAPTTADHYLAAAGALFDWLGIGPPQVDRVAPRQEPAAPDRLTADQDRALLRAAERRGPRDLAVVALMRLNGLRIGEVHRLDIDDYALTARTGPLQVRGKGLRVRTVYLGAKMRDVLRAWETQRRTWATPDGQRALFVTRVGGRMAVRSLRHTVDRCAHAAGLNIHPHTLRHAFAHAYLAGGGLVTELQEDLGHASLATTAIYTRPTAQERAAFTGRAAVDW